MSKIENKKRLLILFIALSAIATGVIIACTVHLAAEVLQTYNAKC